MAQIPYFPRYSQRENFQTNNTLLLLHQLYNFNRFRFEKFLATLLREANTEPGVSLELGLQIKQQVGTGASIVDGYLYQDNLRIAIEAKRDTGSFYDDQLSRHLTGFTQANGGFLILLSPERAEIDGASWQAFIDTAREKNVVLVPVTFENVIAAARGCLNDYDEEMYALVADYEDFCSEEGLLPVDRWTLFAPPCGQSHEVNVTQKLYFCPASWSRRKARYLGIYYEKGIWHLGVISKVVECEVTETGNVMNETEPLTEDERNRIAAAARSALEERGWDIATGHQFFLCDEMRDTGFEKSTPGGILGHRYFDLRYYLPDGVPANLNELAERLCHRQWE